MINRRFAVAPMLDCTDRHCRYFLRLISRQTLLYTEMIHVDAIRKGKREQLLSYHPDEHPLAIQLGGSDPGQLAECGRIAEDYGYDEININCGCPSSRVHSGHFGACLLLEPDLVARCVDAIRETVSVPVTIKTRLGVDDHDDYGTLRTFVEKVASRGCNTFIIHARKALLQGLNPKQNRQVPPLDYARAYRLKQDFPELEVILNGGINTLEEAALHLRQVDGVMLGRSVYHNPYLLAEVDECVFNSCDETRSRLQVLEAMEAYAERQMAAGVAFKQLSRHMLGLFHGCAGARHWRRYISEHAHLPHAGPDLLRKAAALIDLRQLAHE